MIDILLDAGIEIDLRIVVVDEELHELIFRDFFRLDSYLLEAGLHDHEPIEILFLQLVYLRAPLPDRPDTLLLGDGAPEIPEDSGESDLAHALVIIRIVGDYDVELFPHDLRHIDEIDEEIEVSVGLLLKERILLFHGYVLELVDIGIDVHLEGSHDDLYRESQRIEESLIGIDDRILLLLAFEIEVDRPYSQYHPGRSVFHHDQIIPDFRKGKIPLGGGIGRGFLRRFDRLRSLVCHGLYS